MKLVHQKITCIFHYNYLHVSVCGGHISSMKNGSKLVIQTANLNFVKELFPGTNTQMLTLTASLNLIIF